MKIKASVYNKQPILMIEEIKDNNKYINMDSVAPDVVQTITREYVEAELRIVADEAQSLSMFKDEAVKKLTKQYVENHMVVERHYTEIPYTHSYIARLKVAEDKDIQELRVCKEKVINLETAVELQKQMIDSKDKIIEELKNRTIWDYISIW